MKHATLSAALVIGLFPVLANAAASPCADPESQKLKMNLVKDAGHMIYVCGFENPEHTPPPGYKNLSEMKIYSVKEEKGAEIPAEPKLLLETTALETHWVKKDKDTLLIDEVWWVNLKPITSLRSEVTCKKKGCKVSAPKCVDDKKKKPGAKKPVAKKKPVPKGKGKPAPVVDDPLKSLQAVLADPTVSPEANLQEMTSKVFLQALKGNRRAQSFFLESKIPDGLQGDAADEWQASKSQLRRAKKFGCAR